MRDRARRKLFSADTLKPESNAYVTISQHYLSGAAARGLVQYMAVASKHIQERDPGPDNSHVSLNMCRDLWSVFF